MEIEGKIWKDGKFWLVEVPALDAMTQGKTRAEALMMIEDLVFEMTRNYFKTTKNFVTSVIGYKKGTLKITATDKKILSKLSLKRQTKLRSYKSKHCGIFRM